MVDKKVEFDVVAKDKASRKVDDVGDSLDRAGKKADEADGKFRAFASRVSEVGRQVAGAGAKVAAFGSLMGPLMSGAIGVGKALATAGQGVASLAPLIAFAPAAIGGWKFLKLTIAGFAKQAEEDLKPFAASFKAMQTETSKLATKSLPEVASGFQKANFPAIGDAMRRIATMTDLVVGITGRWVNSADGIKLISDVTGGVADAFEAAAVPINGVVLSLLALSNRANVRFQLQMLGEDIANLADRFNAWLDSVSADDVTQALSNVRDAFMKVRDTFVFLRDVGKWMGENEGKVKAFSDALAGLGIALGLFTGNPLAVVAGSLTLVINHWDAVKSRLSGASGWWSATWSAIANDPSVRSIWQSLKDIAYTVKGDLQAAWNMLRPALAQTAQAAGDLWQKLGPLVAQFFRDPNVVAGIRAIALALVAVVAAFVATSAATVGFTVAATAALAGFIAWFTGTLVRGVLGGLATLIQKFGEWLVAMGKTVQAIPGLESVGKAMVRAGQDAQAAAGKVRGLADQIGQLKSKTVTVTVNNVINTIRYESNGNVRISDGKTTKTARARGGPVPGMPSRFDSVPALLSPGEFVVNARTATRYRPFLDRLNAGGTPDWVRGAAAGTTLITVPVTVHAGAVGSDDFLARTVSEQVEASLRQGRGSLTLAGERG